jgi:hypothetical protein
LFRRLAATTQVARALWGEHQCHPVNAVYRGNPIGGRPQNRNKATAKAKKRQAHALRNTGACSAPPGAGSVWLYRKPE